MLLTEHAARLQGGDWTPFFAAECAKPYFAALDAFVTEAAAHTTVYPTAENIFAAFAACPAAGIRAVSRGRPWGCLSRCPMPARHRPACAIFLRNWKARPAPSALTTT